MSLEFRFRRMSYSKERELIEKITSLLKALNLDQQKPAEVSKKPEPLPQKQRISLRNKSMCPKLTVFQYNLPVSVKEPLPSLPVITVDQPQPQPQPQIKPRPIRTTKNTRPRIKTFVKCKNLSKSIQTCEDDLHKYHRILNLTQTLIDKDSLEGWV